MEKTKKIEHLHHHSHHVLSDATIFKVGAALLFLTLITVAAAHVDFGALNFVIAMLIATIKGSLVALIFMNLMYEKRENGVIFAASFLFVAIFLVLTGTDLFFRGDVYVKGPMVPAIASKKSKFPKPWVATPALIEHGKTLFAAQCVACHGPEGKGNGPAAGSLNPPPRNFTATTGWKNGHKPSQIFKTLNEGIKGSAMASFASLPFDDRWALAQFVASLNPAPEKDSETDLKAVGVDPNAAGGGEVEKPTIPVETAIERMAQPE